MPLCPYAVDLYHMLYASPLHRVFVLINTVHSWHDASNLTCPCKALHPVKPTKINHLWKKIVILNTKMAKFINLIIIEILVHIWQNWGSVPHVCPLSEHTWLCWTSKGSSNLEIWYQKAKLCTYFSVLRNFWKVWQCGDYYIQWARSI